MCFLDINLILANNENLTQAQESFDLWNENESGYDWDGLFENMNLVTKASEKNGKIIMNKHIAKYSYDFFLIIRNVKCT